MEGVSDISLIAMDKSEQNMNETRNCIFMTEFLRFYNPQGVFLSKPPISGTINLIQQKLATGDIP